MNNPDLARRLGTGRDRQELVSQAVVVSFNTHGVPPTCTIQLRGDDTPISGVRWFEHYAPTAGDVVWLIWNGTDPMIVGKLA